MNNEDVKRSIITKAVEFMRRFPNVSFRYAYIPDRRIYFVSYQVAGAIDDHDPMWDDLVDMMRSLDDKFGDKAPLFSEGDRTFRLPADAESISLMPIVSERKHRPVRIASRTAHPSRL